MVIPDTAAITYLWSTGDTSATITVNKSGDYKVIVENKAGCSDSSTINVSVFPIPEVKFLGKTSYCPGESIKISLADKYESYLWSTQETTSSITVSRSDNFNVIVTDSNGCNGFGSITITQNPSSVVEIIGQQKICKGSTTTLTLDKDFASYSWSTGDTTKDIVVDHPGSFSVLITDSNGCTGTAFKYLLQDSIVYTGQIPFNFDDLCTGEQADNQFTLKNYSSDDMIISDLKTQTGKAFEMVLPKPLPITLKLNDTITVKVTFKPHEPTNYSDSVVLNVIAPCSGTFKTELTGKGIIKTKVFLPDTNAIVGMRGYHIPIFMQLVCGEKLPDSISFKGEIKYDATLMVPDTSNYLLSDTNILNTDRILNLDGKNIKITKGIDSIGNIVTDILLPNQNKTILKFSKFDNENNLIFTDLKDGSLKITGFCQFDISRLQATGIKNFAVYTTTQSLITNYYLISGSDVHLSLFNQLGEEVSVPVNEYQQQGEHNCLIPFVHNQLSSGLYFIRIAACGEILTEKIMIIQ